MAESEHIGDPAPVEEVEDLAAAHTQARRQAEGGDLTGARTLLEDALAAGELRLGRDHARLAPIMVDLATIARNLGNLTEARNQLRRAYAITVAAAGPENPTSLSIEGRLAAVTYRLGEPTEAYDWHLAEAGRRVLGTDHPAVRGAQQRLDAGAPVHEVHATAEAADNQGWAPLSYVAEAPGVYTRQDEDGRPWAEPSAMSGGPVGVGIRPRSGHTGGIALVASLGAAALVAAAVIGYQLFAAVSAPGTKDGADTAPTGTTVEGAQPPPSTEPPTAPPPGLVMIKDEGGSVTLTWDDPSDGRVPFIVSGGREGTPDMALDSVPAGRTTSTIFGLNDQFNYCFVVSAVWSADKITPSLRTCTARLSTGAPTTLASG